MKWISDLFRFSTWFATRFTPRIRSGFSVTRSKLCLHRHPVDSVLTVIFCNSISTSYVNKLLLTFNQFISPSRQGDSSLTVTQIVSSYHWFSRVTHLITHMVSQWWLRRQGDSSLITHIVSHWWSDHLTDSTGWLISHISHSVTPMTISLILQGDSSLISHIVSHQWSDHLTDSAGCLISHISQCHADGQTILLSRQDDSSLISHTVSHLWPSHWFGRVTDLSYVTVSRRWSDHLTDSPVCLIFHHSHGVTVRELIASCFSHSSPVVDGAVSSSCHPSDTRDAQRTGNTWNPHRHLETFSY